MATPTLHFVEMTVSDWLRSLSWYRDGLGLPVLLLDAERQFALLGNEKGRLALKKGIPQVGSIRLYLQVNHLDAWLIHAAAQGIVPNQPPKTSDEGYRRIFLQDPDGYTIGLFEWLPPNAPDGNDGPYCSR